MKKQKNFIGRLLNRNNAGDCGDPNKPGLEDEHTAEQADTGAGEAAKTQPEAMAGPTMCKDGKLYHARLRNGRWETMGGPIGDC